MFPPVGLHGKGGGIRPCRAVAYVAPIIIASECRDAYLRLPPTTWQKTCTRMRRAMACLYIPRTMQSSRHDVETRLIASLLPDTSSSLAFALAFHYIYFTKIGCGSAKPRREQAPPLVFALAFHYICSTKTGRRPRTPPAMTDTTYGTPAALCLAALARPLTDDDDDRRAAAQGHRPRTAQHRRRAGLLQRQDRNRRDDVGRQRRAAPALV